MVNRVEEILAYNKQFVSDGAYKTLVTSGIPDKKIVILSCMDTRLTELLPKALNIKNGDAKLIKNAGATIMHPFGSIARSIIVAVYEFGVEDVLVIGHYGCGMCHLDGQSLLDKAIDRGLEVSTLEMLKYSGIDVDKWLKGFESPEDAIHESINQLRNHPLMPKDVRIHGMLMHPETGALDVVVLDQIKDY